MATKRVDPLLMDMSNDLKRVDGVMTHILKDRALWSEFIRDPNGVFVRLGFHPPTTVEINSRVNRMFYANLTNKNLLRVVINHFSGFRPSTAKAFRKHFAAGLNKGVIQYDVKLDLECVDHLLRDPTTLRQVLRLSLHDLNKKGILQARHRPKEIDQYIDRVLAVVRSRQAVDSHPTLEVWDRNYGVGKAYGASFVETVSVATSAVLVETGGVATTVAVAVAHVVAAVQVEAIVNGDELLRTATMGDPDSIRAVAMLGRLLDLSSELLAYAHRFEGRVQP